MDNNLTEGQKIIQDSFNHYFEKMKKLHSAGFEDEDGPDIEDWATVESIVQGYMNGEEVDKQELLFYLGDYERMELVLSFYNISKYLIESGATVNI